MRKIVIPMLAVTAAFAIAAPASASSCPDGPLLTDQRITRFPVRRVAADSGGAGEATVGVSRRAQSRS